MSTKTSNYQLHQWEPNDQFLREDFNADFAKIDAGIKNAYDHAGTVESNLTAQLTSAKNVLNAAISKKADQTTVTALQNTVNTKATTAALNSLQTVVAGKCEVVVGSYVGDGKYPRTINLGFQPKVVFLQRADGLQHSSSDRYVYGGIFAPGLPITDSGKVALSVAENGFVLSNARVDGGVFESGSNFAGYTYYYICLK